MKHDEEIIVISSHKMNSSGCIVATPKPILGFVTKTLKTPSSKSSPSQEVEYKIINQHNERIEAPISPLYPLVHLFSPSDFFFILLFLD
jgi:hypothetical protein